MSSRVLLAVVVVAIAVFAAPGQAVQQAVQLTRPFEQCRLTDALQLRSIDAECAEVSVPETDAPGSRRITLSVARIPAINRRKQTDPIVLLAGGPGQGAQQTFTTVSTVFARAARERDILLIDQRGTGRSNLLSCDMGERTDVDAFAIDTASFIRINERCLARLAPANDLRAYTTSHAVRDLEAIRQLLGYDKLNLYAGSYGTRVALHYARRHPQRVRSMVLDGAVAPQTVLGPRIALDAQTALDGIWERCVKDPMCSKTFGDMAVTTRTLQARLRDNAEIVKIANPRTSSIETLTFGAEQLAVVLRLGSYQANFAAMLPLVVTEASRGNFAPLGSLFLLITASTESMIALGMHNSVVCSEDVPRFAEVDLDRDAVAATYLGTSFLDALPVVCKKWPRGRVDADFHQPLVADVPTLLLSGSLDPVTPPSDAERIARDLGKSRHLVFEGSGHGQIALPCMDRVLADFYASADPATLNTQCLDRRLQPPFWISLSGPSP